MNTKLRAMRLAYERLDALNDHAESELARFDHTRHLMQVAGYKDSEIEDIRQHLYGIIESLEDTLPGLQMQIDDGEIQRNAKWKDFPIR